MESLIEEFAAEFPGPREDEKKEKRSFPLWAIVLTLLLSWVVILRSRPTGGSLIFLSFLTLISIYLIWDEIEDRIQLALNRMKFGV